MYNRHMAALMIQQCGADHARVIAKLRRAEPRLLRGIHTVAFAADVLAKRLEQRFTFMTDSAAHADDFRLKDIDRIDDAAGHIVDIAVNHALCSGVALAHGVKRRPSADCINIIIN